MTETTVSIIIPSYNYARFLPETLYSLSAQEMTNINLETIIVDDGSTDGTKDLITSKYPKVKYICQDHKGVNAARNRGIWESSGEYILFLDADDLLAPLTIASQVKKIKENQKAHGVICQ